ncbi:FKBP12-associated protein [Malassezia yamatoensis]|uniref:FKBP12-associated protein n=1 Tax=Malassezia yamatoensis TaxID=253288 RepID=A0AAJ5YYS2_9BASI|nr:FKBP12-associated protein [Malassezia yamatoensis]
MSLQNVPNKICHAPNPCPEEEPCTAVLVRRCVCGHNEKMEVCAMSSETPRRDALAPLDCTPQCKVAQRNAQFASALGLTSAPNASNLYDAPLFRYAATERRSAQAVQDVLADFVQSPRTSAQLRPMLQQLALRNNTEPVRVSVALLDFATRLAKIYKIETEPCTDQGALRFGPLTHAHGADLRIRRVRGAHVPCPTLLDFMASNPSVVKRCLASPAGSPRPAWNSSRTSSPLPGQQNLPANAIMLLHLPEQILNDPPSLTPILLPATRHQQRKWEVHRLDHALILSDIQMEPQSAAVVAAASQNPARASLTASERRLASLMDEVLAAWTANDSTTICAQLVTYDASQGKVLRVLANESDS